MVGALFLAWVSTVLRAVLLPGMLKNPVDILPPSADNSIEPCRSRSPKFHLGHAARHRVIG